MSLGCTDDLADSYDIKRPRSKCGLYNELNADIDADKTLT